MEYRKKEKYKVIILNNADKECNVKTGDIGECYEVQGDGSLLLYNKNWKGHTGGTNDANNKHFRWFDKNCVRKVNDGEEIC